MKIEIKNRFTGRVLFLLDCENNTVKLTLIAAIAARADLSRANLSHADLSHADLFRANMTDASMTRATMTRANMSNNQSMTKLNETQTLIKQILHILTNEN